MLRIAYLDRSQESDNGRDRSTRNGRDSHAARDAETEGYRWGEEWRLPEWIESVHFA